MFSINYFITSCLLLSDFSNIFQNYAKMLFPKYFFKFLEKTLDKMKNRV